MADLATKVPWRAGEKPYASGDTTPSYEHEIAECVLLGALLQDPTYLELPAVLLLQPGHFKWALHRQVFESLRVLVKTKPAPITVFDVLERIPQWKGPVGVPGHDVLMSMCRFAAHNEWEIETAAMMIREADMRRRRQEACLKAQEIIADYHLSVEQVDEAIRAVFRDAMKGG